MYLDLDHFKQINDTYGHGAGDEVLKTFAQRLSSSTRREDLVARLAGDEFVVVVENISKGEFDPAIVARKILAVMQEPAIIDKNALTISTSIGIALHHGNDETMDVLLQRADSAMYKAKKSGRNNYCVAPKTRRHGKL